MADDDVVVGGDVAKRDEVELLEVDNAEFEVGGDERDLLFVFPSTEEAEAEAEAANTFAKAGQ